MRLRAVPMAVCLLAMLVAACGGGGQSYPATPTWTTAPTDPPGTPTPDPLPALTAAFEEAASLVQDEPLTGVVPPLAPDPEKGAAECTASHEVEDEIASCKVVYPHDAEPPESSAKVTIHARIFPTNERTARWLDNLSVGLSQGNEPLALGLEEDAGVAYVQRVPAPCQIRSALVAGRVLLSVDIATNGDCPQPAPYAAYVTAIGGVLIERLQGVGQ